MQYKGFSVEKLQVAAFDWDNTLVCSREALVYSINQILPLYGLPAWEEVKNRRDRNLSFRDNFPRIFGNKAEEAYEKYRQVYLKYAPRFLKTADAAPDVLHFLQSKGVKIIVVSNKDRFLFDFELPLLYDSNLFVRTVCGHEAAKDKPFPEQLEFAAADLADEITPDKVWMIGDSPMDSRCALAAGAKAVRIGHPIWDTAEEAESDAVSFVTDFNLFLQILREQNACGTGQNI